MNRLKLSAVLLLLCTLTTTVFSQTGGKQMPFQGTFYENGIAFTGNKTFTFTIELGANDWTETQANVQIVEGLYSVVLGAVTPIPEDIFYNANSRELTVAVGNTTLGTTTIFAPFALSDGKSFEKGNFILNTKDANDSTAIKAEITGSFGKPINTAITAKAITESTNIGIYGLGEAPSSTQKSQTGVKGEAIGKGAASATGLVGIATTSGGDAKGVVARVNGSTASGSSRAVEGINSVHNTSGSNLYGGYFETQSSGNSNAQNTASVGVYGRASGSPINYGVYGSVGSPEGDNNWAGRFDGKIQVNFNSFIVGNKGAEGTPIFKLGYFNTEQANGLMAYSNAKRRFGQNRSAFIGADADTTGGSLKLFNFLDKSLVDLRATRSSLEKPADDSPFGQLKLQGPNGQNIYLGAKANEQNGADVSLIQLFGAPVGSASNTTKPEMLSLSSQKQNDGKQQGVIELMKEDAQKVVLNRDSLQRIYDFMRANQPKKYRFGVNAQNAGTLRFLSSVDSVSVLIESNGPKAGRISVHDSLGRESLGIFAYPGGASYMRMYSGIEKIKENRITAQYWGGYEPYINLIGRDENGNPAGRSQLGKLGGNNGFGFRVTDAGGRSLADLRGDATNGADLVLHGPSTSNFWLGQKNWENSNLPFMAMRGENTRNDNNGNAYIPDGLSLQVSRYGDGSDVGVISFGRIKDGLEYRANLDYFNVQELLNPKTQFIKGERGNTLMEVKEEKNSGNYGRGVLRLYADGNDANGNVVPFEKVFLGTRERFSGFFGMTGHGGRQNVQIGMTTDAGNHEFSTLHLLNDKDGGFEVGSRSWESVEGGYRTYAVLKGTRDINNNGNVYRPWLVANRVHIDGTKEHGEVEVISNSAGQYVRLIGDGGNIDISGSLNSSSDRRLKKDIKTLTSGLAMVNQLRGVRFHWKDETRKGERIGFIAQEVEEVLPELVKTKEDGYKGVNYAEMTAVLVEAVKELSQQVEELKQENSSLKAEASKVSDIEDRLALIEQMLMNNSKKVNSDQK